MDTIGKKGIEGRQIRWKSEGKVDKRDLKRVAQRERKKENPVTKEKRFICSRQYK